MMEELKYGDRPAYEPKSYLIMCHEEAVLYVWLPVELAHWRLWMMWQKQLDGLWNLWIHPQATVIDTFN